MDDKDKRSGGKWFVFRSENKQAGIRTLVHFLLTGTINVHDQDIKLDQVNVKGNSIDLYFEAGGRKALAVLQNNGKRGAIRLIAKADGLPAATLIIRAR